MARSHGRFAQLYVSITSGGSAAPLSHTTDWSIAMTTDKADLTAQGDTNKVYAAGLPDGTITFSGFASDTASTALIAGALDGIARKWYGYPFNSTSIYMYGTGFVEWTTGTSVSGGVTMNGTIAPASAIGTIGF